HLVDERRLADARLSGQHEHTALAHPGARDELPEPAPLPVTSDQHPRSLGTAARPPPARARATTRATTARRGSASTDTGRNQVGLLMRRNRCRGDGGVPRWEDMT